MPERAMAQQIVAPLAQTVDREIAPAKPTQRHAGALSDVRAQGVVVLHRGAQLIDQRAEALVEERAGGRMGTGLQLFARDSGRPRRSPASLLSTVCSLPHTGHTVANTDARLVWPIPVRSIPCISAVFAGLGVPPTELISRGSPVRSGSPKSIIYETGRRPLPILPLIGNALGNSVVQGTKPRRLLDPPGQRAES